MVASLRLAFPRMQAASSHCLRLMGYSLPVRECLTFEFVMRMIRLGSANGMGVASSDLSQKTKKCMIDNDGCKYVEQLQPRLEQRLVDQSILIGCLQYLQSMSKACPSLPRTDTN